MLNRYQGKLSAPYRQPNGCTKDCNLFALYLCGDRDLPPQVDELAELGQGPADRSMPS